MARINCVVRNEAAPEEDLTLLLAGGEIETFGTDEHDPRMRSPLARRGFDEDDEEDLDEDFEDDEDFDDEDFDDEDFEDEDFEDEDFDDEDFEDDEDFDEEDFEDRLPAHIRADLKDRVGRGQHLVRALS